MSSTLEIRAILRDEFSAAVEKMKAEILSLGTTATTAGAAMRQGMSSVLPTMESVNESLGRQNAQLRAQAAAYKSPEGAAYLSEQKRLRAEIEQLTSSGEKQGNTWTDLASKYYMVSQALGIVANATMAVVDASARYDTIKVRLDAFEGSARAGAQALEKIQTLAKQPGLGMEQASSAYASLRALKESGPEAVAIIEAIAHANASMGGGAEEFGRAMMQIQQMLGKGKLMAEDINTISESIPNFRALIMDAFGTTDTKAINAKYSVDELLKGIEQAAAKLPAPGETIRNNMDNLGDAWTRLMASLGQSAPIKEATGLMASMIEKLAKISEDVQSGKLRLVGYKGSIRIGEGTAVNPAEYGGGETSAQMIERMTKKHEETGAERTAREAREKAAKKYAEAVKKNAKMIEDVEIDAFNKAEQDRANRNQSLRMKLGSSDGLIKSEAYMKEDKKQDDDYWKDREKAEADYKKQFNANQKVIFAAYKLDEEKKTKITGDEWKARSDMARSYADTLAGTMASAYTDIWVNGRDVFASLYDAFSEMITKMAIEMAAKATIFGALSLIPGMGGATGLLGGAGSFIFGARASGGAVFPGMTYRKNEDAYGGGGEPFRPSTAGTIMPNRSSTGTGSDGAVHYHFAAGTSRADAGYIVRAIQQGTRERRRTVSRGL